MALVKQRALFSFEVDLYLMVSKAEETGQGWACAASGIRASIPTLNGLSKGGLRAQI